MTQGKAYVKNGNNIGPKNHWENYSTNNSFLNEYIIIGYKFLPPPQEDVGDMPHEKIPGKNGEKSEPNNHGKPNSPNIAALIEQYIIGCALLLIPKQYDHKFWLNIVTIIYDHGTKVTQDLGHTQLICSINDYQHEEIMSHDIIKNRFVHQEDKYIVWKLKHITSHEKLINTSNTN